MQRLIFFGPTYHPRPDDRPTATDWISQGKSQREKPARAANALLDGAEGLLALLSSGACSGEGEREEGGKGGVGRGDGFGTIRAQSKSFGRGEQALKRLEPRTYENQPRHTWRRTRTQTRRQAEEELGDSSAWRI